MRSCLILFAASLFLLTDTGCSTTCQHACSSLAQCSGAQLAPIEKVCIESCQAQDELFGDAVDHGQSSFESAKACYAAATCEELESGACTVDGAFVF